MYKFFVSPSQINKEQNRVVITGPDVNHIKNVLRMKKGEEVSISNGKDGREYCCAILEMHEDSILLELRFIKEEGSELPVTVTLFQGLPVSMKRCVVKLDDKKSASKIERWQAIAESAAKQSKRGIVTEITPVMTFENAVGEAARSDIRLLPYEMADNKAMNETRKIFENLKPGSDISVFIGPEGGFDEGEIEMAKAVGLKTITLGKRILRTETAGMTVMSWIVLMTEGKK